MNETLNQKVHLRVIDHAISSKRQTSILLLAHMKATPIKVNRSGSIMKPELETRTLLSLEIMTLIEPKGGRSSDNPITSILSITLCPILIFW